MFQIDNSTASTQLPTISNPGTPGFFTDGNPATGQAPTIVPAEWLNTVMMELCNAVSASGQTLTKGKLNQLALAIQSQGAPFAIDTGTANTYVVNFTPAFTSRTEGQVIRFKAKTANTGASTLNDGIGAVPLVGGAHSALQGGEIAANGDCWAQWNSSVGGAGSYILLEGTGGALQVGNAAASGHALNFGQANSLFAPLISSLAGTNGAVTDANSASVGMSYFGAGASNVPFAGPGVLLTTAAQNGIAMQIANATSGSSAFRFYTVTTSAWGGWTTMASNSQVASAYTPINSSTAGSNGTVADANAAGTGLSYFGSGAANVPAAGPGVLLTMAAQNGIAMQIANTTSGSSAFRFYTVATSTWGSWTSLPSLSAANVFSQPQSVGTATAAAHAVRLDQFNGLFSSGSAKLPNGNIIKIGTAVGSTSGTASITFPTAFPNYCQSVIAIPQMGQAYAPCIVGSPTTTGFSLDVWGVYSTAALGVRGAATVMYIAFGG